MTNRVALPDAAGAEEIEAVLVAHMRRQILAGLLPPGTRLGEEALGGIFGVNRSRIRRILHTLALDRLVDLKSHCGASIATPSIREAKDVFEARRTIERVTTEIVARTIQTPRLAELRTLVLREDDSVADKRAGGDPGGDPPNGRISPGALPLGA